MTNLTPGKLWGMRRMADEKGLFKMTAVDQRPPIKNPIAQFHGTEEAPYDDVARVKAELIKHLQGQSSAMLLDPHYAIPKGLSYLSPQKGLIVTLEDSIFTDTPLGRKSSSIEDWDVGKIKRMGGDAVKVLAWYRPDGDDQINRHQQDFTKLIGEACANYDIPFLFELLVYPLADDEDQTKEYVEMSNKKSDQVLASVEEFAKSDYGVDVFKLESPVNAKGIPGVDGPDWESVQSVFDEMGRLASRPWIMLSAGAGKQDFRNVLTHAYRAGASGYLAGRAIWLDAFGHYPDWEKFKQNLLSESVPYMEQLNRLTESAATPWYENPLFSSPPTLEPGDGTFRNHYQGFDTK